MTTWQTNENGISANVTNADGSTTSMLLSAIPPEDTILPYIPDPAQVRLEAIASIDAQLLALDMKRIRPTAEGDAAYLATLNAKAIALRTQRDAL